MVTKNTNLTWHDQQVTKEIRRKKNNHKSCVVWFTGLSASGKSTIANAVEEMLNQLNVRTYLLDGDNVRHGLNKDLGFSPEDRKENIRRIGEVAKLFVDAGMITMTAFISPYKEDRQTARDLVEDSEFIEVYIKCSLEECEKRDPKGLYQKARDGIIPEFTGISAPYEEPENAELIVESDKHSIEESANIVINFLREKGMINE